MDIEKIKNQGALDSLKMARISKAEVITKSLSIIRCDYRPCDQPSDDEVLRAADRIRTAVSEIEAMTAEINRLSPPESD